jgi:hypothetical protein
MRLSKRMGAAALPGKSCGAIRPIALPMPSCRRASRLPTARLSRGGGCTFAEDPRRSCAEVTPIWSAAVDPCVLLARCVPTTDDDQLALFLAALDVRSVASASTQHLCIAEDRLTLRIDLLAGELAGAVGVQPIIDLHRGLECQVDALRQLYRLLSGCPLHQRQDARLQRLVLALRVGDALAAGASLRIIGTLILGFQDWPGESDSAKSSTRRIVDLARLLKEAGPAGIISSDV